MTGPPLSSHQSCTSETYAVTRTGRLVEVALQDMLVEDEQRFQYLEGMLVGS